jgi:signal transduction histidine kinase
MPPKGQKFEKMNGQRKGLDRALGHLKELDRDGLQNVAGKLCAERALLEMILKSLQEAVVVVDRWGMIELINPAGERMLGIPNVEAGFPNPSLWRAVPELGNLLHVASDGALYAAGNITQEMDLHYPLPRTVRLFLSPINSHPPTPSRREGENNWGSAPNPIGAKGAENKSRRDGSNNSPAFQGGAGNDVANERFLLVLSDCTDERMGTTRQLEEARLGALTQLAAGVAHELGNPLNALQIHLQLMERELKKLESQTHPLPPPAQSREGNITWGSTPNPAVAQSQQSAVALAKEDATTLAERKIKSRRDGSNNSPAFQGGASAETHGARDNAASVETLSKSLSTAQNEIKRLDRIIRNFLQAIRPAPANLQPTDVVAVLEEVLTVMRPEMEPCTPRSDGPQLSPGATSRRSLSHMRERRRMEGAQIRVEVELPGVLPMVLADAEQLKQVYFNLLKNAREAMESGGTLKIRATTDDEWLKLHFTDNGSGIRTEALTHLFEPYYTTKQGGTGLGMMIAQKIMRAHRGTIGVESRERKGTTVTLAFPLKHRRFRPLNAPEEAPRLEG